MNYALHVELMWLCMVSLYRPRVFPQLPARCAGDERSAQDAYQFLQGFLERFPQYRDRPLWIAGGDLCA